MHWRVPVDDVTTRIFWVSFTPSADGKEENGTPKIVIQPQRTDESGRYTMDTFMSQDAMAVETQGPVLDRSKELLGASDRGIMMYRDMLKQQIETVQAGGNPMANIYGEAPNMVDLRRWMGGYLPMSCAPDPTFRQTAEWDDIFDDAHIECEIPESSPVMRT